MSAGAVESPASLDFASNFFSNVRYITPMAAMRNPPDKLFFYVSEMHSAAESFTYMRVKSSTFIAGSKVKELIARQATIQVPARDLFCFKNCVP